MKFPTKSFNFSASEESIMMKSKLFERLRILVFDMHQCLVENIILYLY